MAATMTDSLLCPQVELAEGQSRGFASHGVFIVRHAGQVYGWRDACPHYGDTPLAWRTDAYLNADASRIVCAAHGAQFLPDTGLCTLGPCLGQSLTLASITLTPGGMLALACPPSDFLTSSETAS
jgi:nitrite reductase/ring-hydroxylating ferredoxin subunit